MSLRTYAWLIEKEYAYPGRDETVLRMAGLVKQVPIQDWYMEIISGSGHPKGGRQVIYHDMANYVPTAPNWAIKMARQLVEDQAMIQRLKIGRRQKRSGTKARRVRENAGLIPEYILMIPIEIRAQILSSAASNSIVHAMVTDEQGGLETAIIIARDMKKKVGS